MPFAREDSGIAVPGNAWQWWENAAGVYERGSRPALGSVLVFQANRNMRLGHVAVVSRIYNSRQIEVDQANCPIGRGITYSVPVVDVSPRNDWTSVRVALGDSDRFGSIYPTYGFIYAAPDRGMYVAAVSRPAAEPILNPSPSDLRGAALDEELAEAPASPRRWHARGGR